MAEVVGLTASIIGILQLTGKTIAVSYNYCSSVKSAPQDIQEILAELSELKKVLETLQKYVDANPGSEALNKLNEPDGAIHGITGVLKNLYDKLDGKGASKLADRLKWPLREKETAKCVSRIERHKTLFIFALTADHISLSKALEAYAKNTEDTVEGIKSDVRDTTLALYDLKLMSRDTNEMVKEIKADAYNTSVAIQGLQSESVAQKLWRETQISFAEAERRKSALNWLYPDTFDTKHIEISGIRQPGTGEWLLRTHEIREWIKKNPNSPILWGYGIPGAGKTFLCSVVIDHLQSLATTANHGLAYIYFDYKEQDRQKPVQILASLVKQLLYQLIRLPTHIEELYNRLEPHGKRPTLEELFTALVETLTSFDQVFFVFDALDECSQKKQRTGLLPLFHRMGKNGIHVFITSRQYPEDIQDSMSGSANIELCASVEDIRSYIEQKIDENARAKRLVKQGKCRDLIISELIDCAKGIGELNIGPFVILTRGKYSDSSLVTILKMCRFLLVHFHIEYICEMTNVRLILRALESLKNSSNEDRPLDPTYDRAMETVKNQGKGPTKLAMKILAWLVKARRTLSVDELREAVAVEENRYELDEWDWTDKATLLDVCAGLVTIDEKSNTIRLIHYTVQEYLVGNSLLSKGANLDIAMACATYLSFDVFSQPAQGLYCMLPRIQQYPFLYYASRYLPYHLSECDEDSTMELLLKLLESPGHISSYAQASNYRSLADGAYKDKYPIQKPLHVAASVGHKKVTQLILDEGADIEAEDSNGERALQLAAFEGHKEMVELLLMNGADISARGRDGFTMLHTAARAGHDGVVKMLLENGADVSSQDEINGSTPLHLAVVLGHSKVVELLLESGASIASPNKYKSTPLHLAVGGEQPAIIDLLLKRGADIEATDSNCWTPLHIAASSGRRDIVVQLLDRGADITARTDIGRTPLHTAVQMGRNEVVQLLIDRGSDLSVKTIHGSSLLLTAACGQRVATVQMLLRSGADLSLLREYGDAILNEELSLKSQTLLLKIVQDAHAPPKPEWLLEIERKAEEDKKRRIVEEKERESEDQNETGKGEGEGEDGGEDEGEEQDQKNTRRQCIPAM